LPPPSGPNSGSVGTAIAFNGSASYEPDGTITLYEWSFGNDASGAMPTHAYPAAGTYNVTLTVTNNQNVQTTATTVD
jgi:PKD repeat protein